MFLTTIAAIALGYAPVYADGRVEPSADNYARMVGRHSESVDRRGRRHITGFNEHGQPYDIAIDADGKVQGVVGEWDIDFTVKQA